MGSPISWRKVRLSLKVTLVATLLGAWVLAHQVPAVAEPGKNAHVRAFAQLLNNVAPENVTPEAEGQSTLFPLRSLAPHLSQRIGAKDPSGAVALLEIIKQQDEEDTIRISNTELRKDLIAAPQDGAELDVLIERHVQGLAASRETKPLADILSVLVVVLTWPATHADLGERQQWTDADQKKWAGRVAEREKDLASLERMAAVLAVNSRDGARLSDGGGWRVAKGVQARLNNSYEWFRWRNVVVPLLLAADFDNPTWLKPRPPRKDKEGNDIAAEWVLQRDSEGLIEEWYRGVMDYWQSRADANADADAGIWARLNGGKEPLRPDLLKSLIEPVHDPLNQSPPAPPLLLHPALPIQDERKKQSWVTSQAQLSPIIAAWLNSKDSEVLQLVRAANGSSKSFSSDPVVLSQKGRRISQDSFKRWEAAAERRYPARLWELRDLRPQGSDAFNTYFRRKDPLPVKDHHDFLLSEPVRKGFAQDVYQNGIPPQATELRELYQEHRLVYDLNGVVDPPRPAGHELELWGRLDYLAPFEPFVDANDGNGLWKGYPNLRSAYYAATGMSSRALPDDIEIASEVEEALDERPSPFLTRAATVVMIHQMTFTASGYGVPDKPAMDLARTLTSPNSLYRLSLQSQLFEALEAFDGNKAGVRGSWSPLPLAFVVLDLMLADAAGSLNGFDERSLGAYPTEGNQWQDVKTVAAASDRLARRYITEPTEALKPFTLVDDATVLKFLLGLLALRINELERICELHSGTLTEAELQLAWNAGVALADGKGELPDLGLYNGRQVNSRSLGFVEELVWEKLVWLSALNARVNEYIRDRLKQVPASRILNRAEHERSALIGRVWTEADTPANCLKAGWFRKVEVAPPPPPRSVKDLVGQVDKVFGNGGSHKLLEDSRRGVSISINQVSDNLHKSYTTRAALLALRWMSAPAENLAEAAEEEHRAARILAMQRHYELEAKRHEYNAFVELANAASQEFKAANESLKSAGIDNKIKDLESQQAELNKLKEALQAESAEKIKAIAETGLKAARDNLELQLLDLAAAEARVRLARRLIQGDEKTHKKAILHELADNAEASAKQLEEDLKRQAGELEAAIAREKAAGFFKAFLQLVGGVVGAFFGMPTLGIQLGGLVGGIIGGIIEGKPFDAILGGAFHEGLSVAAQHGFDLGKLAKDGVGNALAKVLPANLEVSWDSVDAWFRTTGNDKWLQKTGIPETFKNLGGAIKDMESAFEDLRHVLTKGIDQAKGQGQAFVLQAANFPEVVAQWLEDGANAAQLASIAKTLGLDAIERADKDKLAAIALSLVPAEHWHNTVAARLETLTAEWRKEVDGAQGHFAGVASKVLVEVKNLYPTLDAKAQAAIVGNLQLQIAPREAEKRIQTKVKAWHDKFTELMNGVIAKANTKSADREEALGHVWGARNILKSVVVDQFVKNQETEQALALLNELKLAEDQLRAETTKLNKDTISVADWQIRWRNAKNEVDKSGIASDIAELGTDIATSLKDQAAIEYQVRYHEKLAFSASESAASHRVLSAGAGIDAARAALERAEAMAAASSHRAAAARTQADDPIGSDVRVLKLRLQLEDRTSQDGARTKLETMRNRRAAFFGEFRELQRAMHNAGRKFPNMEKAGSWSPPLEFELVSDRFHGEHFSLKREYDELADALAKEEK